MKRKYDSSKKKLLRKLKLFNFDLYIIKIFNNIRVILSGMVNLLNTKQISELYSYQ
jgi:hypothetical protein